MKVSQHKGSLMVQLSFSVVIASVLIGCGQGLNGSSSLSEDSSSSGAAAEAVGGALSASSSSGTIASLKHAPRSSLFAGLSSVLNPLPQAFADSFCPTFKTTTSACSASGGSMWLDYSSCSFSGRISWTGVQEISMSSGSAVCGTFPNPGANGTLYRRFVSAQNSTTAGELTLTSSVRTSTVDDASNNLSNFDGATIAAINPNGGYGTAVSFDSSGRRNQVVIGHHISVSGVYDHSVTGTLSVSENSDGSSRNVSGSVKVYHNLARVVGTSTFTDVVHDNTCCLPISGTIQTTFAAGDSVSPTILGARMIGKTETLTFNGCGSATLTSAEGGSISVSLDRCF